MCIIWIFDMQCLNNIDTLLYAKLKVPALRETTRETTFFLEKYFPNQPKESKKPDNEILTEK